MVLSGKAESGHGSHDWKELAEAMQAKVVQEGQVQENQCPSHREGGHWYGIFSMQTDTFLPNTGASESPKIKSQPVGNKESKPQEEPQTFTVSQQHGGSRSDWDSAHHVKVSATEHGNGYPEHLMGEYLWS